MLGNNIGRMHSIIPKEYAKKLRRLQERIANKVILKDKFHEPIRTIAGFDLAFFNDKAVVTAKVAITDVADRDEFGTVFDYYRQDELPTYY